MRQKTILTGTLVVLGCFLLHGCSAGSGRKPVQVDPSRPVETLMILAEADPDLGEVPLEVQFSVEPMLEIDEPTYEWDFGDGSPFAYGERQTHTYERAGRYHVRVRAFDKHGNLGDDHVVVDVEMPW